MLLGVENFRDFGGYAAGPGRWVRSGMLFRAAHLGGATTDDLAHIDSLGIKTIVDLRRRGERLSHPYPPGSWTEGRTIITSDMGDDDDPWLAFLRRGDVSATAIRNYAHRFYVSVPFDGRYVDLFSRYFQALATCSGALLVHCAAGKDRTGLLVAMTHMVLGVHRDDLVANFLVTNRTRSYEMLKDTVAALIIEESGGRAPSDEALRIAIEVDTVFLDAAFDTIIQRCGSFDRYFTEILQLSSGQRAAIAARLIVTERP